MRLTTRTRTDRPPTAFQRLAVSNLLAHFAEQIGTATLLLIAVSVLHTGAGSTGTIQMLATLPFLLFAIPIGTLADLRSPARVMIAGELLRVLALTILIIFLVSANLTIAILALLGLVGSTGTVAYTVGAPTIVSDTVPRHRLLEANRAIELTRSLAIAAGPALAGAMIGWTGATPALVAALASSLLACALLTGVRSGRRRPPSKSSPLRGIREGAAWTLAHPLMRPIIVTAVLFNTAWFCMQGVFVAFAIDDLGLDAAQVGWTLACYGIGMIVGAATARGVFSRLSVGAAICIGPAAGLVAIAIMNASAIAGLAFAPAVSYFLLGAGPILWTISTTTLRQAVTPTEMLGRVSAVIVTTTAGARPIGAGLGALIAVTVGVQWSLLACLVGMVLQLLVILHSPVARLEAYPDSTVTLAIPIEPQQARS